MPEERRPLSTDKERRYRCEEEGCRVKPFSNKHDLARHRREVHRKDSEGRTPREHHCPVIHCKRHRQGFGRQWNMVQHCVKVHGDVPSQIPVPNATHTATSSGGVPPESSAGASKAPTKDLRGKLDAELDEAKSERTRTLRSIEDKIEALMSERDLAIKRSDEKIKALENLINVLGEELTQ